MVLEEITKEVTDAESNAENQKNSLSGATQRRLTPEERSTRQGSKTTRGTDEVSLTSLASTVRIRRRSRSSLGAIRRLSTELTKSKRRRESLSALDAAPTDDDQNDPALGRRRGGGMMELLAAVREEEREFPDGYGVEVCGSFEDARLIEIHERRQREDPYLERLDAVMLGYNDDAQAALLKFLDSVIGYVLYVSTPASIGVTSAAPLDRLVALWVAPEYHNRGLEKKLLHWWLRHAVRSVKYFTVRAPSPSLRGLLREEGFKLPKPNPFEEDHINYIAQI